MTITTLLLLAILASGTTVAGAGIANPDREFDHSDWATVLERFVDDEGYVDYSTLAADREALDRYIRSIETTSPDSDPERFADADAELAYWINAYNAQVFLGVLDWGPDIDSVWSGLISGRNFFVKRKITVGGERMNLKSLEDDIVRARYQDPRIHAALNCASIGCPRLPREPFLGATLDEQLDAAMKEFTRAEKHVRIDAAERIARLSKIFDWFEDDFIGFLKREGVEDPTLLDYVNRYRTEDGEIPDGFDIRFLDYDKGLNRQ